MMIRVWLVEAGEAWRVSEHHFLDALCPQQCQTHTRPRHAAPNPPPVSSLSDGADDLARAFMAGDDDAARVSWEVRLVLELCDRGSLRALLSAPGGVPFALPGGNGRDMLAVVSTALDVARAMLHLHSVGVVHSDLKARNVLLKTAPSGDARGFVAKVADFGLSLQLPDGASHVSGVYQGTMVRALRGRGRGGAISRRIQTARRCLLPPTPTP